VHGFQKGWAWKVNDQIFNYYPVHNLTVTFSIVVQTYPVCTSELFLAVNSVFTSGTLQILMSFLEHMQQDILIKDNTPHSMEQAH